VDIVVFLSTEKPNSSQLRAAWITAGAVEARISLLRGSIELPKYRDSCGKTGKAGEGILKSIFCTVMAADPAA
jgi:hypothetical protein